MSEMNSALPVQEEAEENKETPKQPAKAKPKKGKKGKRKSKGLIIVTVIVVLAVIGLAVVPKLLKSKSENQFMTALATKGDIAVTISGSGTVTPIEEYTVSTPATGEVVGDYIKEGQSVKKGDLLYQIEDGTVQTNIQQAEINVQKAQQTYSQSVESVEGMTVKAPFSGVLTAVNVKEGDSVQSGMKLAEITDMGHMTLTLPFNAGDVGKISVGQQATVILSATGEQRTGTVTRKYTGTSISATGALTSNIEIELADANGIQAGATAVAVIGNISCNAAGTMSYKNQATISAKTGGTVAALNYKAGDLISSGEVLLMIENDQTVLTATSSEMSVLNAQTALDNATKQLDNYYLKSTVDGTVIQKNTVLGDDLAGGEKLAVISDMSKVKFEISVDELDITKVSKGQAVSVTADAITDKTFAGTVDYVSSIGSTQNGVTVYAVTIVVDGGLADGLKPGMNVTGTIAVQSATGVVRVPVSAVQRGNRVLVKSASLTGEETVVTSGNTNGQGFDPANLPQGGNAPQGDVIITDGSASDSSNASGNAPRGNFRRNANNSDTTASKDAAGTSTDTTASSDVQSEMTKNFAARRAASGIGVVLNAGKDGVPEGYEYVEVTLGLSDSNYIEIKSGLSAGAIIAVPVQKVTENTSTGQSNSVNFGMGGFGAMPSGNVRIREDFQGGPNTSSSSKSSSSSANSSKPAG